MQVTELPLDQLQAHPSQFLFHDLGGAEWDELVKDVQARGIQQPITVSTRTGEAVIVDGHQRARAAREAGLASVPAVESHFEDEREETLALVMANVRRRHLTREERRQVIAQMLKLYPGKSNRQHAESLGVDHKTVKVQRKEMESTGEIPQLEKTVGADGKTRTANPARKEMGALGQFAQVDRVTTLGGESHPIAPAPSKPKPQPVPVAPELPRVTKDPFQQPTPIAEESPAQIDTPLPLMPAPESEELEPWQVDHSTVIDLTPTPFEQRLQEIGYEEARSFEACAQRAISALASLNHYSRTDLIQIAESTAGRGLYAPLRLRRLRELLGELQVKVQPDEEASRRTIDAEALN